jgi:hypothetical protein
MGGTHRTKDWSTSRIHHWIDTSHIRIDTRRIRNRTAGIRNSKSRICAHNHGTGGNTPRSVRADTPADGHPRYSSGSADGQLPPQRCPEIATRFRRGWGKGNMESYRECQRKVLSRRQLLFSTSCSPYCRLGAHKDRLLATSCIRFRSLPSAVFIWFIYRLYGYMTLTRTPALRHACWVLALLVVPFSEAAVFARHQSSRVSEARAESETLTESLSFVICLDSETLLSSGTARAGCS